jgi:ribosomal protein S27AE
MSDLNPGCPKCQGVMVAGWVPDTTRNRTLQSAWLPGKPEPRESFLGIRWKADQNVPITAFRCANCGYLEFYAKPA